MSLFRVYSENIRDSGICSAPDVEKHIQNPLFLHAETQFYRSFEALLHAISGHPAARTPYLAEAP